MLCAVYKSIRKSQTYLFIAKRDDFKPVPDPLLTQFGPPQLVTLLNITADKKLAMADADAVITAIQKNGYYLQLPPPPVNYLKEHKAWRESQLERFNETEAFNEKEILNETD
ncbi:YcgL domain-containing protein [Psychromonas hadalis]|uniref:YcgL domain-containing protein n=1 Tax=Psychromonas hadalis TaxID=211669 RepID=UPI0003B75138|nr:YcgL domain-containing protein [Psychromonas hadalis]